MIKEKMLSTPRLLAVTERMHATTGEVHPGWIRATSILLKGMERLKLQEASKQAVEPHVPL